MFNDGHSKNFEEHITRYDRVSSAFRACISWIEHMLQVTIPVTDSYRSVFASGELLCSLLNKIVPQSIKRINRCPNRASATDNLSLFLTACEERCRIPKSKLFDISDFEDIFERGGETNPFDDRQIKHTEKVVISLFWLAKFVEQDPPCRDFPKLDFSAFTDLLPRTSIRSSLSLTVENYPARHPSFSSPCLTPRATISNGAFDQVIRSVTDPLRELHRFVRHPVSVVEMGNTESAQFVQGDGNDSRQHRDPPSQLLPERQTNNNGTEEDEWQAHLDDWRERRRRLSRMKATKMMSLEQLRLEEERKRQQAARDRLRHIKMQRNLISDSYVPSGSLTRPIHPSSPGLALLTGVGLESFDFTDEIDLGDTTIMQETLLSGTPVVTHETAPIEKTNVTTSTASHDKIVVSDCLQSYERESRVISSVNIDAIPSVPQCNKIAENNETVQSVIDGSERDVVSDLLFQPEFQQVQIRIQSKMKSAEMRWGISLQAQGPFDSPPFIVNHVKIGSTADVCDVNRGDILIRVNETDLHHPPGNQSDNVSLRDVELMLDQLSASGQVTHLQVLRKRSRTDNFSDDESDNHSSSSSQHPSESTHIPLQEGSDVDEQSCTNTALIVNRNRSPITKCSQDAKLLTHDSQKTINGHVLHSSQKLFESAHLDTSKTSKQNDAPEANANKVSIKSIELPTGTGHLRNAVTTRLDISEAGASHLQSPSQVDESVASRTVPTQSLHHADTCTVEPMYLSLASNSTKQLITHDVLMVRKSESADPTTVLSLPTPSVTTLLECVSPFLRTQTIGTPITPLPSPPPLPLLPSTSPSSVLCESSLLYSKPKPANLGFRDDEKSCISHTQYDHCYTMPEFPQKGQLTTSTKPNLPSPPPPIFFTTDVFIDLVSTTKIQRPSSSLQLPVNTTSPTINSYAQVVPSATVASEVSNKPWEPRGIRVPPRSPEVHNQSVWLTAATPPHSTSPLFFPSTSCSHTSRSSQSSDIDEQSDKLVVNRDCNVDQSFHRSNRGSYPPPPPPSFACTNTPPQPPRVPLNRGINPKSKCTACTQELGTGDLMVISSMSLYYHLACFVCSWCGAPLSDGLSNADVRIRSGQLYCQPCYPSRHKTAPQGDSRGRNPTPNRTSMLSSRSSTAMACMDRRVRHGTTQHNHH